MDVSNCMCIVCALNVHCVCVCMHACVYGYVSKHVHVDCMYICVCMCVYVSKHVPVCM
jgi:hypothetical protein